MKYLLLFSLTGFLSWPYYNRMRSFEWEPAKSYIIGLLPSFLIALGITKTLVDISDDVYIDFSHLPDILTQTTFIVILLVLIGLLCWLMFTAEWCQGGSNWSTDSDGAFVLAICMFAVCVAQAFFVTDLIVKVAMVI